MFLFFSVRSPSLSDEEMNGFSEVTAAIAGIRRELVVCREESEVVGYRDSSPVRRVFKGYINNAASKHSTVGCM